MNNRFFSLIIVPDSGGDIKTGSFNFKFILGFFSSLIAIFFLCLFFIVGYHIKLSQEKNYKQAVTTNKRLVDHIKKTEKIYNTLSEKLAKIQQNDRYFRLFERMDIIDEEMYMAGIGGHVIVDETKYSLLGEDLKVNLDKLDYSIITLDRRVAVMDSSFRDVQVTIHRNREMIDNTPSILPTHSIRFTQGYEWRNHPISRQRQFHAAVDIAGYLGQEIFATADGIVISVERRGPLGNCIRIEHKYGYVSLYGHLSQILVKAGQKVKKNDLIGKMGSTGTTTGVHIHYAVLFGGRPQNPMEYFK